jgi:hydroxymethylpyrimidine pyrophosphatase-like HAD family hydrolase
MGNALASAKQQANYTTDSHNNEGVYNMLIRLEDQGLFK